MSDKVIKKHENANRHAIQALYIGPTEYYGFYPGNRYNIYIEEQVGLFKLFFRSKWKFIVFHITEFPEIDRYKCMNYKNIKNLLFEWTDFKIL